MARPGMSQRAQRLALRLAWIAVALALVLLVRHAAADALRPSHNFVAYYTLSRLMVERVDVSRSYGDDEWFRSQMDRFQRGAGDVNYNPPTTALLVLPLADLPTRQARLGWTLLNLACVLLACGLIAWFAGLPPGLVPLGVLLVILCQPLAANFSLGHARAGRTGRPRRPRRPHAGRRLDRRAPRSLP
ncbi:MAG: glycosyltransferase 87 family protein [Gaiellaceae bacterium]